MKSKRRLFALVLSALLAGNVSAETLTWTGLGADANWSTAGNWLNPESFAIAPVAGDTLIFAGTTQVANINDLPAGTLINGISIAGGAANNFALSGNAIDITGTLANNRAAVSSANPTIANNLNMVTDITVDIPTTGVILNLTGVISGAQKITKTGSGIVVLNNAGNTFSGGLDVTAGVVRSNNNGNSSAWIGSGVVSLDNGGAVEFRGTGGPTFNSALHVGVNGGRVSGRTFTFNPTALTGTGTLTIANDSGSITTVRTLQGFAGTILATTGLRFDNGTGAFIGASGANAAFDLQTGGSIFQRSATNTLGTFVAELGSVSGVAGTSLGGGSATAGSGYYVYQIGARNENTTFAGNIIDTTGGTKTSIRKVGTGVWTLSGDNLHTQTTQIVGGTIKAGKANTLSAGSAMVLDDTSGVTLDLDGFDQTVASLAGGGLNGGNVSLGAGVLTTGGDNSSTAFNGVASGAGGIIKTGTGTMTLGGTNTYTGATTINGGSLALDAAGTIDTSSQLIVGAGATFDVAAKASYSYAGAVSGDGSIAGSLVSTGSIAPGIGAIGTLTALNNISLTGAVNMEINSSGLTSTFDVLNAGANVIDLSSGTAVLNVSELSLTPTYSDGFQYDLFNGTFSGTFSAINLPTLVSGWAWRNFGGSLIDYSTGVIQVDAVAAGTPGLWKGAGGASWGTGANWDDTNVPSSATNLVFGTAGFGGIVNLDGVRTVSGSISISNGSGSAYTLAAGTGGSLDLSGSVSVDTTGTQSVTAPIVGSGSLVKAGAGTLVLSGTNTYTGGTTVNAGTLELGSSGAVASGSLTVNNAVAKVADTLTATAVDVGTLTLTGTGALDLNKGGAVLNGTTTAAVRAQLIAGRTGGTWSGAGIRSSYATTQNASAVNSRSVGYRLGGTTFMGVTSSASDVLVRTVRTGDLNLDGNVNVVDRSVFSTNFGTTVTGDWFEGDLNYDGNINIVDRSLFSANFGQPLDGGVLNDAILGNGIPNFDYNPVTGEVTVTTDGSVFALILIDSAEANFLSTVSDPDGALGATWNPAVYSGGMNWSTVSFANTAFLTQGTWTLGFMAAGLTAADFATTNGDNVFYADNNGASNVTNINILNVVAVPEPSSVALIGLAGVYFLAQRRRRA